MAETMVWVEPDGTTRDLTAGVDTKVLSGRVGAFMPPVAFVEDTVPLQPGARLREVRFRPREVDLVMMAQAASASALRTLLRSSLHWFDPTRGEGTLRVQVDGGIERELRCRYAGGLELSESQRENGRIWQKFVLTLRAVDPFWYGRNAIVATYLAATGGSFFPILPLRLASSTIFADAIVTNAGDVEAWPVWTITGPGSGLVLSNQTTNKRLALTQALLGGETVTIDTRPGQKTVRKNDGANLFGSLSSDSSLWSLQVGDNSIRVELSGSTTASSVVLSYYTRYLGA